MLQPGDLLQNRYRIVRQIGGGGMAVVYLAEDIRLAGRRCAIKEMSPSQLAAQDRNSAISAFKQEAEMLARLHHPGLAAVTDFFAEQGNWYLVMDYVEGETLQERLDQARRGRLSLEDALDIIRQLCKVLEYLHNQSPRVVFRDLKPDNVMLKPDGDVRLIDFGIARFFKPGQTQDTVNLGTFGYAAPEQYGGSGQSDPRADIYALGVLLHQMVTGYDPTTGSTPFPLPPPGDFRRGLPERVIKSISRAVKVKAEDRFPDVRAMRDSLFTPTSVMSDSVVPPPPSDPPTGLASRFGLGAWIGFAFAGVLLIGLCVFIAVGAAVGSDFFGKVVGQESTAVPSKVVDQTVNATSTGTEGLTQGATPTPEPAVLTPTQLPPTSSKSHQTASDPTSTASSSATVQPRIVYVGGPVGNTDIYVAEADGGGRKSVAGRLCDEAEPCWSPDGRKIAYQADCDSSYDLWIVDSDGGERAQLTRTSGIDEREPDWSPDGSEIVFRASPADSGRNADGELWIMSSHGTMARSLGIRGRSPVWSPDGGKIVFMSERTGGWEIYIHNLADGSTDRLTDCSANCRWPAWSPNGQYVIYHSTTGPGSVTADTIWYVTTSGLGRTRLVEGSHPGRPTWSVNGWILFNSDKGIEAVQEDGNGRRVVIGDERNWAPIWSK
jgi:serine/threonine-protein kinase